MVPVAPHGAATAEHAVDRLGDADGESLDPAPERRRGVRLDHQMHVIVLDRERDDAERASRRTCEGCTHDREDGGRAQRRGKRRRTQRHVDRRMAIVPRPNAMRDVGPTHRLATGADSPTTVPTNDELELFRALGHG